MYQESCSTIKSTELKVMADEPGGVDVMGGREFSKFNGPGLGSNHVAHKFESKC